MNAVPLAAQRGVIIIVSSDLARYSNFGYSLLYLLRPPGTHWSWQIGLSPAAGVNAGIAQWLPDPEVAWFWIIGDDHMIPPDTLSRLLDHDLDIVTPLCARRHPPIVPCMFINGDQPEQPGHFPPTEWKDLPLEGGLVEVAACGNSGMLLRRSVVETMAPPWFEVGQLRSDELNEDCHFCLKARDAGFQLFVDTSTPIGHITPCCVWPRRTEQGWTVELDLGALRARFPDAPMAAPYLRQGV